LWSKAINFWDAQGRENSCDGPLMRKYTGEKNQGVVILSVAVFQA
jgi:hypothetical protein